MSNKNQIPLIDISKPKVLVAREIGEACEVHGFFAISGHGVDETLQADLEKLSAQFFALPEATKKLIAMKKGGPAWRGFFEVGEELTSGKPDLKEGIYFGEELDASDARVKKGFPLHGANLFPTTPDMKLTVLSYMKALEELGHKLMGLLSLSLKLKEDYFYNHYTKDPTLLFRIFHYPPVCEQTQNTYPWGVGAHTDYGILTILKQDLVGGLEVYSRGQWVEVPPVPNTFVCNIGDMLDFLTRGHYRSAPHRVRNTSGKERYSFPFFFDPNFSAPVLPLPLSFKEESVKASRWDGANLYEYNGSYGDYLIGKVSKVFPGLAQNQKLKLF